LEIWKELENIKDRKLTKKEEKKEEQNVLHQINEGVLDQSKDGKKPNAASLVIGGKPGTTPSKRKKGDKGKTPDSAGSFSLMPSREKTLEDQIASFLKGESADTTDST